MTNKKNTWQVGFQTDYVTLVVNQAESVWLKPEEAKDLARQLNIVADVTDGTCSVQAATMKHTILCNECTYFSSVPGEGCDMLNTPLPGCSDFRKKEEHQ